AESSNRHYFQASIPGNLYDFRRVSWRRLTSAEHRYGDIGGWQSDRRFLVVCFSDDGDDQSRTIRVLHHYHRSCEWSRFYRELCLQWPASRVQLYVFASFAYAEWHHHCDESHHHDSGRSIRRSSRRTASAGCLCLVNSFFRHGWFVMDRGQHRWSKEGEK